LHSLWSAVQPFRAGFARDGRTIDIGSGAPSVTYSAESECYGTRPAPVRSLSWPLCSSRWWGQWWRLRHRSATPLGAIDAAGATWTILGEGAATPNLQILGLSLWLLVDSADYLRLPQLQSARCLWSSSVIWKCFVTIKCPNDQSVNGSLAILDIGGRVISRRSGLARPHGSPGQSSTIPACALSGSAPGAGVWYPLREAGGVPHPAHLTQPAAVLVAGYPGGLPARRGHGPLHLLR